MKSFVTLLCLLGCGCHCKVFNVVPGFGTPNNSPFLTYPTENYEFCHTLCISTSACKMAVVSSEEGKMKYCNLLQDLFPPSQLQENSKTVSLYEETRGLLIGDQFYYLEDEANTKEHGSKECEKKFEASMLTIPTEQETRAALDFIFDSDINDVWLNLLQYENELFWSFKEQDQEKLLKFEGKAFPYSLEDCFHYHFNGKTWVISPENCDVKLPVVCTRKIPAVQDSDQTDLQSEDSEEILSSSEASSEISSGEDSQTSPSSNSQTTIGMNPQNDTMDDTESTLSPQPNPQSDTTQNTQSWSSVTSTSTTQRGPTPNSQTSHTPDSLSSSTPNLENSPSPEAQDSTSLSPQSSSTNSPDSEDSTSDENDGNQISVPDVEIIWGK